MRMIRHGTVVFGLISGQPGGGQRVALAVARELATRGARVAAIAPDDGPRLADFREIGGETYVVGALRSYDPRAVARIAAILRETGGEYLYTHTVPTHEAIFALGARLVGTKLVIHRHILGHLSSRRAIAPYQRWLWARGLRQAEQIISVSREVAAQVEEVSGKTSTIVPNGVPIPPTLPQVSRTASPMVGFVGRLDPNKRVEDFIVAASLVVLRRPEARFVIAGGGTAGSRYELRCRELALMMGLEGRLTFAGPVANASDIMQSLDVFVLPSVLEGHPLVVLEAMALGKAVVVTDIAACRDTVTEGVDGRVVPAARPRILANAIADLLDDPAQRERLGTAARLRAMRDFTEERMVRDLLPFVMGDGRGVCRSDGHTASAGEQKGPVGG